MVSVQKGVFKEFPCPHDLFRHIGLAGPANTTLRKVDLFVYRQRRLQSSMPRARSSKNLLGVLSGLQNANEEWDVPEVGISVLIAICFGLEQIGLHGSDE